MDKNRIASVMLVTLSLLCGSVQAHDVTIYPVQQDQNVRLEFFYGDPGDYQPIDRVRFVELSVFDSSGVKINFLRDIVGDADNGRKAATPALRLGDWPSGTYVASVRYDNGFYIHDGENRAVATTREWLPESIDSAHYQKFSKALFHVGESGAGYDRVPGHRLELIPRADPFLIKRGALLPVELRFDGAAVANHVVEIGDETAASKGPEVRTNADGIVWVPISRTGYYRLAADQRAPSKYPDLYAYDDYTASLVFSRQP